MDKKRINKISKWSKNYGSKLLIVAYFIPGVRHVTGYFSGITKVPYKKFAIRAYSGAFIWTFTFITLGKVLGPNWEKYHSLLTRYLVIAGLIIAVIILLVYAYRNYNDKIQAGAVALLKSSIKVFHSFGTMKVFIAGVAAIFLVFSALVIGIIQDYFANEFGQFDELAKYLTTRIFDESWNGFISIFSVLSSNYALSATAVITVIWIALKGSNKLCEIGFLILSLLGAEGISVVLRIVFHRTGPSEMMLTFPSGEVLMSAVAYGFLVYMLIKQSKKAWINSAVIGIYFVLCGFVGISLIYFNTQYPSDVAAGFEFGMVWLSLSIILLELYRILPKIREQNFAT